MTATITERDIRGANFVAMNVATSGSSWPHPAPKSSPPLTRAGCFMSAKLIYAVPEASAQSVSVLDLPAATFVSPLWLGRVKRRIRDMAELPANWDSYGAVPVDRRIPPIAEDLVEWFAVAGMPPPDVFATSDGGIQIEWHIRRVNIEIEISPIEGTTIYFQDLNEGEPCARPSSATDLQMIRRRLLTPL